LTEGELADDIKQKPPPELITAGAHTHCADGWFEARGKSLGVAPRIHLRIKSL
jgi:hypothetical protein